MNKIKMMAKKLALLAVMALPLVLMADIPDPGWDELVKESVYDKPGWLYWGVSVAAFVVVSVLLFWDGRRRKRPILEFIVFEVMIGAALAAVFWFCGRPVLDHYEERVIHHPGGSSSDSKCPRCGTTIYRSTRWSHQCHETEAREVNPTM